jgi:hypothetical protein
MKRILLLLIILMMAAGLVWMTSLALLPAPPSYPTPTYPKGIELPDERPVPWR